MPLDLPGPIAEFFAAEKAHDPLAIARRFIDVGVVRDEGGTFRGTDAIRDWNVAVQKKYHYTLTPMSVAELDGTTVVAVKVTGGFPGSPITFDYIFRVEGDKIASLEIR